MTDARQAVTRSYTAFHAAHEAAATLAYVAGDKPEAERHHAAAVACAWSLESEMANRPPQPATPGCPCAMCSQYMFRALS